MLAMENMTAPMTDDALSTTRICAAPANHAPAEHGRTPGAAQARTVGRNVRTMQAWQGAGCCLRRVRERQQSAVCSTAGGVARRQHAGHPAVLPTPLDSSPVRAATSARHARATAHPNDVVAVRVQLQVDELLREDTRDGEIKTNMCHHLHVTRSTLAASGRALEAPARCDSASASAAFMDPKPTPCRLLHPVRLTTQSVIAGKGAPPCR